MKDDIADRIDILYSFPSNYSSSVFNLNKRKKMLKYLGTANLIILFLAIGLSITAFFTMHTTLDFYVTWDKMGLLVIISVPFFLRAKNDLIESKIIKHIEFLNNVTINANLKQENTELIKISKVIKKSYRNHIFILLGIVILGAGLAHVIALDNNSGFWRYIIYVYFTFVFYSLFIYSQDKILLDKNINSTLNKITPLN